MWVIMELLILPQNKDAQVDSELTETPVNDTHHFPLNPFFNGDISQMSQFLDARIGRLFREANQFPHYPFWIKRVVL